MKKFIVRNGVRSNLRAKKRSILFFALIFMLSLLVTLGTGMYTTSLHMIDECEKNYLSVIKLEYLGEDYPSRTAAESYVRDLAAKIDPSKFENLEGVKSWNPTAEDMFVSDQYSRTLGVRPMMGYGVYVVSGLFTPEVSRVEVPLEGDFAPEGNCAVIDQVSQYIDVYENGSLSYTVPYYWVDINEEPYSFSENTLFHTTVTNEEGIYEVLDVYPADIPQINTMNLWGEIAYNMPSDVLNEDFYKRYWKNGTVYGTYEERVVSYRAYVDECIFSVKDLSGSMVNLNIPFNSEISPEGGGKWLVFAAEEDSSLNGLTTLTIQPFETDASELPYHHLSGKDDPLLTGGIFVNQAELFYLYNNYIVHRSAQNISVLGEFQQGDLFLEQGRFPDAHEQGVCVISGSTANRMGVSLGDTVSFECARSLENDYYRFRKTGESKELTVVGITSVSDAYEGYVWTSDAESDEESPLFGYEIGVIEVQNAKGPELLEEISRIIPGEVNARLLDQGYKNAVEPMEMMRSVAFAVTLASFAGLLSTLALFSFLYITRQKETFDVMNALGTSSKDVRTWFLSGAFSVIVPSSLAGSFAGALSTGLVMAFAMRWVKALYTQNLHFSETLLGSSKELPLTVSFGIPHYLAVVGIILISSAVLCLLALSGMKNRTKVVKGVSKVRPPKGGTSLWGKGSLRHAVLSMKRSGPRSLITPLTACVLAVLIGLFASFQNSYDEQIRSMYEKSAIDGRITSLDGLLTKNLVVAPKTVRSLINTGIVSSVSVSRGWNYWLEGEMPEFGSGSFSEESRQNWIKRRPELIALNRMEAAPEFSYSAPGTEWMEGYDESILMSDEWNFWIHPELLEMVRYQGYQITYPALVSRTFLETRGMALGDEMSFWTADRAVRIKIVGTFTKTGDRENIYVPLSYYYPAEWLFQEEDVLTESGSYRDERAEGSSPAFLSRGISFSTCRFEIDPAAKLDDFRKTMYEAGYSEPGHIGSIRTALLLRDGVFTETVGALERFKTITNILMPIMMAVICVIGFLVSWLLIHGRKMEFALMRGFGLSNGKVFRIFFTEQMILSLAGGIIATGILWAAGLLSLRSGILLGVFILVYWAGVAIAVRTVGKVSLLQLLQEGDS